MSFALLRSLLKLGHVLSITPPSFAPLKIPIFVKTYPFLIISFIAYSTVQALINKKFYFKYTSFRVVASLLGDLILFLFSSTTVLSVPFCKTKQWECLLKNIDTFNTNKKLTLNKIPLVCFIAINLFVVVVLIYVIGTWHQGVFVWFLYEQYGAALLQLYSLIIYNIFLWEIINVFRAEYKYLNHAVSVLLVPSNQVNIKPSWVMIECRVFLVKESVDLFNDIFGWPVTLNILFAVLQIISCLDHSYDLSLRPDNNQSLKGVAVEITIAFVIFSLATIFILFCDSVVKEADKMLSVSRKMMMHFDGPDGNSVQTFTVFLVRHFPRFSAAQFFNITRSTVLGIVACVVNLLIVMVQFHPTPN
jgi:gustatory receptor